jgi:hypothetical protein|nr:MAG TPA: Single-stranded DNA-binding protein/DNA complex, OB fold, beta-barrel, single-stranded [Caudoviricetes sp.]
MARQFVGQKTNYLRVNYETGNLCIKLSEDEYRQELAKGNTNVKMRNVKDGVVGYVNEFPLGTEIGYIDFLGVTTSKFPKGEVKMLTITIKGDVERDSLSVPLYVGSTNNLDGFAKSIIKYLPNLDFTKKVSFNTSGSLNAKGKMQVSVFFNQYDDSGENKVNIKAAYHVKSEKNPNGNLPPAVLVSDRGKEFWDSKEQDDILFNVLTEQLERFKQVKAERGDYQAQGVQYQSGTPQVAPQPQYQQYYQPQAQPQVQYQQQPAPQPAQQQFQPQYQQTAQPQYQPQAQVAPQPPKQAKSAVKAPPAPAPVQTDDDDLPF